MQACFADCSKCVLEKLHWVSKYAVFLRMSDANLWIGFKGRIQRRRIGFQGRIQRKWRIGFKGRIQRKRRKGFKGRLQRRRIGFKGRIQRKRRIVFKGRIQRKRRKGSRHLIWHILFLCYFIVFQHFCFVFISECISGFLHSWRCLSLWLISAASRQRSWVVFSNFGQQIPVKFRL